MFIIFSDSIKCIRQHGENICQLDLLVRGQCNGFNQVQIDNADFWGWMSPQSI